MQNNADLNNSYSEKKHLIKTRKTDLIKRAIYSGISSGIYRKNSKIPSCRMIAEQLKVSKNSVYKAYAELIELGILRSENRSGFIVNIDVQGLNTPTSPILPKQERNALPLKRRAIGNNLPDADKRAFQPKCWTTYPYPFVYNQIDSQLFPLDAWRICSRNALKRKSLPIWISEAVEFDSPDLIYQIRKRLLYHRGINVLEDEILITVGAQHALNIISTLFMEDPRPIVVEDPGYQEARHLFRLYNHKIIPTPLDDDGLNPDYISNEFKLIYLTPGCQFPSMVVMPEERRKILIEKAQAADALIIEDDYETGLLEHTKTVSSLKSLDQNGTVIYVGSLSKSFSPSIRMGYIVAHRDIIKSAKIVRSLTVRHPPSIIQETTALFLADGYYDAHLKKVRQEYSRRWHTMAKAIDQHLPMLERGSATGGTSFWLKGSVDLDSEQLAYLLIKSGVLIEPGHIFHYNGEPKNYFRIAFPSIAEEKINEGIKLIAQEIRNLDIR